jgi:hypothetical protein
MNEDLEQQCPEPETAPNAAAEDDIPDDLIPTCMAIKIIPSPRTGKKTNLATLYRWMAKGRLRWWKNGRYRFVSRREVLRLLVPGKPGVQAPAPTPGEVRRRNEATTNATLERLGIIPDGAAARRRSAAATERILREAGI